MLHHDETAAAFDMLFPIKRLSGAKWDGAVTIPLPHVPMRPSSVRCAAGPSSLGHQCSTEEDSEG